MAIVEELKEMIIDLRVELARSRIPDGHCPYAYYPGIKQDGECEHCDECKRRFFKKYEDIVRKEIQNI